MASVSLKNIKKVYPNEEKKKKAWALIHTAHYLKKSKLFTMNKK